MRTTAAFFVLIAMGCTTTRDPPSSPATLILKSGKIWTGNAAQPGAEAVALGGDRILAVGTDTEIRSYAGAGTRVIDLGGRLVVPGFTDSHVHFVAGGDEILAADLRSARSQDEFARRLGEVAKKLPPGTWITSGSWDHESWPEAQLPTRELLDPYTPEHPVFVSRLDGHMAVANSLALTTAKVTRDTRDPPGGAIVRDPKNGEPAGVLKDAAMGLVSRHVPSWTRELRRERARAALRHAAELGLTGVHDMGMSAADLAVLTDLGERGELTTRITVYVPLSSYETYRSRASRRQDDAFLRVNGVKAFADGSLGSSTALFFDDYLDSPGNRGLPQSDLSPGGELESLVERSSEAGLQVAIHGIGDRAIRDLLDMFERVAEHSPPVRSFRIEHAQHIHPDDLPRFPALGVIASMQPFHAIDDGRWAEKRIGHERAKTTYAFRDLLDRGAMLAFGSDWPVAPLSPIEGIYAAVTRQTLDGEHPEGWIPEQKIRVEEALRAYTHGGPHAAGRSNELGSLEPGKLADLVVLDTDVLTAQAESLRKARVDLTVVGGRVVYERTGSEERHGR